jgi:hypothetical protein
MLFFLSILDYCSRLYDMGFFEEIVNRLRIATLFCYSIDKANTNTNKGSNLLMRLPRSLYSDSM